MHQIGYILVYRCNYKFVRAGVETEVTTTMCNLSFLVERLISGNRSLTSVHSLRGRGQAEAEHRTRAHELKLQASVNS